MIEINAIPNTWIKEFLPKTRRHIWLSNHKYTHAQRWDYSCKFWFHTKPTPTWVPRVHIPLRTTSTYVPSLHLQSTFFLPKRFNPPHNNYLFSHHCHILFTNSCIKIMSRYLFIVGKKHNNYFINNK